MSKVAIIGLSGESIFMKVNEFHKSGETIQAQSLYVEPGGKGYNQAIACKRLGSDVSYLSCVGHDAYGKYCEEFMKNESINTFFIYKDTKTPLATILTNKNGDNQVTVYKGAITSLDLKDLNKFYDEIKNSDVLLLQEEIPYEVLKEALIYAFNHNVYTILNPAPAVYDISELLPYINLLIPNEIEAQTIFGPNFEEIETNKLNVIVTMGEKGIIIYNKGKRQEISACKANVIDTTGAGDVFVATVASFIKEKGLIPSAILANKVASLHIEKPYVLPAIPYYEDIKKYL